MSVSMMQHLENSARIGITTQLYVDLSVSISRHKLNGGTFRKTRGEA